jgi:hypothetical protein
MVAFRGIAAIVDETIIWMHDVYHASRNRLITGWVRNCLIDIV